MSLRESMANLISGGAYSQKMAAMDEQIAALRETSYELERAIEDIGWQQLSGDAQGEPYDRAKVVPYARWAFESGCALTKCAILTKTFFCYGDGVDGPAGKQSAEMDILRAFWTEPSNQASMFSTIRQYERSFQLLCDGDLFYALSQPAADGILRVRRFDSLQVLRVIVDPDDPSRPLYYAVRWQPMRFDPSRGTQTYDSERTEVRYYRDWQNRDDAADPYADAIQPGALYDGWMMHTPLNRVRERGFGVSDVAASLRWFNASKRIAEDQMTISAAVAKFASQMKVQGNASQIDAISAALKASVETATNGRTTNGMGAANAPVNVMPNGVELSVDKRGTQALDAWQNSRMMRVPGVAGMNMALHYLGDPENANLATTKSIELPLLKGFTAYQSIQRGILDNLCDFQLELLGIDAQAAEYDIPMPPIIQAEAAEVCAAIMDAAEGGYITDTQASMRLLNILGSDDPYREMQEIEDARGEQVQEQAASSVQALQFEPGMDDEGDAEDAEGAAV